MKKILVVDDDNDILTLVQMVLSMHSFTVEAISKWEQIDDVIKNFSPGLILLDVSLSGADGRDICRRLKSQQETQHIPVILFSAHADVANNFKDCNAQGFIAKPFELSHFIETLDSNLAIAS
jgi:DNA-binding response OmpR family regulator